MPDLVRYGGTQPDRRQDRLTSRALANLERQTIVRVAGVQADGLVQSEKLREIDHLAREAMTGQAVLRHVANTLASGDPFLADELKLFGDLARAAKAEIISDTISTFTRENRR